MKQLRPVLCLPKTEQCCKSQHGMPRVKRESPSVLRHSAKIRRSYGQLTELAHITKTFSNSVLHHILHLSSCPAGKASHKKEGLASMPGSAAPRVASFSATTRFSCSII